VSVIAVCRYHVVKVKEEKAITNQSGRGGIFNEYPYRGCGYMHISL